ncbi:hypothetical protein RJ641_015683, partial [Dillenia turbinata]
MVLMSVKPGYGSDGSSSILTIRHLLAQLIGDRDDDFSIQLVPKNLKKVSAKFLTTSQKRNIRRQAYLNEVSQRNDSVFFATIGGVVILTPVVILGIAILTGYRLYTVVRCVLALSCKLAVWVMVSVVQEFSRLLKESTAPAITRMSERICMGNRILSVHEPTQIK